MSLYSGTKYLYQTKDFTKKDLNKLLQDSNFQSKEHMVEEATNYLNGLTAKVLSLENFNSKDEDNLNNYKIEIVYIDGLKLIKLEDEKLKYSYLLHLQLKTDYSFSPIFYREEELASEVGSLLLFRNRSDLSVPDLKKLKEELFYKICLPLELDAGLACNAWVYLEYLIQQKGVVNVKNKNYVMCICFLLSLKFFDIDDVKIVKRFYEIVAKVYKFDLEDDMLANEMRIYALLNFSLMVPVEVLNFHLGFLRGVRNTKIQSDFSSKLDYGY